MYKNDIAYTTMLIISIGRASKNTIEATTAENEIADSQRMALNLLTDTFSTSISIFFVYA
jgi:hypothetical protein